MPELMNTDTGARFPKADYHVSVEAEFERNKAIAKGVVFTKGCDQFPDGCNQAEGVLFSGVLNQADSKIDYVLSGSILAEAVLLVVCSKLLLKIYMMEMVELDQFIEIASLHERNAFYQKIVFENIDKIDLPADMIK